MTAVSSRIERAVDELTDIHKEVYRLEKRIEPSVSIDPHRSLPTERSSLKNKSRAFRKGSAGFEP